MTTTATMMTVLLTCRTLCRHDSIHDFGRQRGVSLTVDMSEVHTHRHSHTHRTTLLPTSENAEREGVPFVGNACLCSCLRWHHEHRDHSNPTQVTDLPSPSSLSTPSFPLSSTEGLHSLLSIQFRFEFEWFLLYSSVAV